MFAQLKSIRARLTIFYTLLTLVTLVVFGFVAYTYSADQLEENLDRSLTSEVKWIKDFIRPNAGKVRPSKRFSPWKTVPLTMQDLLPDEHADAGDADDQIWSQIYRHTVMNPKKAMIEVTYKDGSSIFRSYSAGEESLKISIMPFD